MNNPQTQTAPRIERTRTNKAAPTPSYDDLKAAAQEMTAIRAADAHPDITHAEAQIYTLVARAYPDLYATAGPARLANAVIMCENEIDFSVIEKDNLLLVSSQRTPAAQTYTVDPIAKTCTCPDATRSNNAIPCKHRICAALRRGIRATLWQNHHDSLITARQTADKQAREAHIYSEIYKDPNSTPEMKSAAIAQVNTLNASICLNMALWAGLNAMLSQATLENEQAVKTAIDNCNK